jgi:sporulation protein YqfC
MFSKILDYIKDNELKISLFKDKINVVNYKEILVFDDNKIVIDCSSLILTISGSDLIINKLYNYELLITGNINKIEYR